MLTRNCSTETYAGRGDVRPRQDVLVLGRFQWCWAHLRRDFQGRIDSPCATKRRLGHGPDAADAGTVCVVAEGADGTLSRQEFGEQMKPIRASGGEPAVARLRQRARAWLLQGVVGASGEPAGVGPRGTARWRNGASSGASASRAAAGTAPRRPIPLADFAEHPADRLVNEVVRIVQHPRATRAYR